MKIRPVEAELFHADRQTNMTKLIVAIRIFANEPKNKANTDLTNFSERRGPLFSILFPIR
jgi:hypothetical protein